MNLMEVTIERLASGGSGLAHHEGETVFVPFTAPGDVARARVTRRRKGVVEAELVELLRPGGRRRAPLCPLFGRCGGCQMQHLSPEFVGEQKREWVVEAMRRIARLETEELCQPLLTTDQSTSYRRRASLKGRQTAKGAVVGFFAPLSHVITDLPACPALAPPLERLISPLRSLIAGLEGRFDEILEMEIACDEAERTAVLFHLPRMPSRRDRDRLSAFAVGEGLSQAWLRVGAAEKWSPLRLEEELADRVEGMTLAFRPGEFVQVHAGQNRRLAALVLNWATEGDKEATQGTAWDLFCGIGNFTLPLAKHSTRVVGVEGALRSVERARRNAALNGLNHVRVRRENLFDPASVASLAWSSEDRVVLDPPRDGAEAVCRRMADHPPGRIVYVSCDPATLARDAALLVAGGWRLDQLQPVEMFPLTRHVETAARFVRD